MASECPVINSKNKTAHNLTLLALQKIKEQALPKINLIWLETCGCSGNIISLLNATDPNVSYLLKNMVNLRYNNSLMAAEGEAAYQSFLQTLDTDFTLVVEGAIATNNNGLYNIVARYNNENITGLQAAKLAGEKAKYVLAVGTCASFGGISAARPNPSGSQALSEVLEREVIIVPGCPTQPDWVIGTLAHLIAYGRPELDSKNRPLIFYGISIHDYCPRRSFFDEQVFAKKLGDPECMFKLGCRGPITRTDCPLRRWNDTDNWPIGVNTPCIGCAREGFPDGMEPFVRY